MSESVYGLLADLLAIAGKYEREDFERARIYALRTFNGSDRDVLIHVLEALGSLRAQKEEPFTEAELPNGTVEGPGPLPEVETRELKAILQDPAFLTSKEALQSFVRKHFARLDVSISAKDSRAKAVRKVVDAFRRLPAPARQSVYVSARREYMRGRQSNLREWAEIIGSQDRR